MSKPIDNTENIIDSREVLARIEYLEDDLQAAFDEVSQERLDAVTEELTEALDDINILRVEPDQSLTLENLVRLSLDEPKHPQHDLARAYETLSEGTLYDDLEGFIRTVIDDEEHALYDEAIEYKDLKALESQGEDYGDWTDGATLIHEDHFVDYCKEMVSDVGDLPKDLPEYLVIDWEATAENLRADYMEIEFGGENYWMRA